MCILFAHALGHCWFLVLNLRNEFTISLQKNDEVPEWIVIVEMTNLYFNKNRIDKTCQYAETGWLSWVQPRIEEDPERARSEESNVVFVIFFYKLFSLRIQPKYLVLCLAALTIDFVLTLVFDVPGLDILFIDLFNFFPFSLFFYFSFFRVGVFHLRYL